MKPLAAATSYLGTVACVALAGVARWLFNPWLGDHLPFVTFFVAVAAAAWLGGLRPALLATLLGFLLAEYFFVPPRFSFLDTSGPHLFGLAMYFMVCFAFAAFGEAMRRAQYQSELRKERLRITLASIGDAVITTDTESRITNLNAVAESLTGWKNDEAAGQPLETVFHIVNENSRKPVDNPVTRALREGVIVGLANHTVLIAKDGTQRPIDDSAAPIQDERGKVAGVILIFRDISEPRKAQQEQAAVAAARHRLAQAVLSLRLNSQASVEVVLQVITEQVREIIGAHQSVTSMTDGQDWSQAINALSLSEKYGSYRTYDSKPDGSGIYSLVCRLNKPLRMTQAELEAHPAWRGFGREAAKHPPMRGWLAAPLLGADGRSIGLIQLSDKYDGEFTPEDEAILLQYAQMASGVLENVQLYQEQKQTANELRRVAADLSEADRRKNEFLAMLAHELRNPLAPIRNALEILRLSANREAVQSASEMMERQVGQMVRLVDDLLDVSRISRGKIELRKERVELASVVQHAVEAIRPRCKTMDHELTVTLAPQPVYLNADPTRLAQVVGNLLNNACKFTERGGRIGLTVEREGGQAVIRVRDSGIGIAADQLPRIFEMFTQVDTSLERTKSGLGIGLSLAKNLVEMHGGTVEAHSAGIGQGSEFVVRLPVMVETPEPPPPEPTVSEPTSTTARRILVVDDNLDSAESLAILLQLTGNKTHTAYDGLEAVEAAATFRPEVVLLDIGLPRMNGFEAARKIRAEPWGKKMVLVALTGWGQEEDRQKSREAGFDGHLVKPVDPTALTKLLAELGAG